LEQQIEIDRIRHLKQIQLEKSYSSGVKFMEGPE